MRFHQRQPVAAPRCREIWALRGCRTSPSTLPTPTHADHEGDERRGHGPTAARRPQHGAPTAPSPRRGTGRIDCAATFPMATSARGGAKGRIRASVPSEIPSRAFQCRATHGRELPQNRPIPDGRRRSGGAGACEGRTGGAWDALRRNPGCVQRSILEPLDRVSGPNLLAVRVDWIFNRAAKRR